MEYNLITTDQFWASYFACQDYLFRKYNNVQAILAIEKDMEKCLKNLKTFPEAYEKISSKYSNGKNLRKAHLSKHRYKIVFEIDDSTIVVKDFFHDLEDYENKL